MAKERLKSPRARLFVALDLPEAVIDALLAWQGKAIHDPALRPQRREQLHITLAFLGYHPEREIETIAEVALHASTAATGAAGAGTEPRTEAGTGSPVEIRFAPDPAPVPRNRPRLFALDARSPEAEALQAEISDRLRAAGRYRPEKRPFWPHLTVARVRAAKRGGKRPATVSEPPGALPEGLLEPFGAVRIALYRSYLRSTGAEYVRMAQLELPDPPSPRKGEPNA